MHDCIFCKIINKEIPCYKIYENEHVKAFLDVNPTTNGHTLVIPKGHYEDIFQLPPEVAAQIFQTIPKIATSLRKALNPCGLNVLNNNGAIAGQTVFHYHVHLIPRYSLQDNFSLNWEKDVDITVANTYAKITGGNA